MVAKAKTALAEILNLMGMNATVAEKAGVDSEETILEVKSDNSGLIIGRKGQTLEALQYLVSRIAGERPGNEAPHVVIVFCQNDLCHGAGLHLYLSLPVCEPSFLVSHGLNRGWVNRR